MTGDAANEPSLREADFLLLQRLVEECSGIHVASPSLFVQRLARRLRELELDSFTRYCHLVGEDPDERCAMLEAMCTHETRFFREPQQLRFLEEVVCDQWEDEADAGKRPRALRLWSVGCAFGEEAYSIAMVLRARLPSWQIEILASDLSTRALSRVRTATWPIERAEEIPTRYLHRFMLEGTGSQSGLMRAVPELVSLIHTSRVNLSEPSYPVAGSFEVIFCRNVLIYFRDALRQRVLDQLLRHLIPGGYLFLGHAEGLGSRSPGLRSVGPIVYRSASEGES